MTAARARPPVVWVFAGLDPTGGAGLLADTMTLAGLGVHPCGIATLLSGQDPRGVHWWDAVPAARLLDQALPLVADLPPAAVKIGAVGSADNAVAIADLLACWPDVPVVLDPVLGSERGDSLAGAELVATLRTFLLPRATLITPNRPEACRLAGVPADTPAEAVAGALREAGARAVLLTGGHDLDPDGDTVLDQLWQADVLPHPWRGPRWPYAMHGSGCLLASAIAAGLAHGLTLTAAIDAARDVSASAWAGAWGAGPGQRLPGRSFFNGVLPQ